MLQFKSAAKDADDRWEASLCLGLITLISQLSSSLLTASESQKLISTFPIKKKWQCFHGNASFPDLNRPRVFPWQPIKHFWLQQRQRADADLKWKSISVPLLTSAAGRWDNSAARWRSCPSHAALQALLLIFYCRFNQGNICLILGQDDPWCRIIQLWWIMK